MTRALTNGTPIGAAVCVNNVNVVDGVFTVPLDFGAQFAGQERFLQIEVRADTGLDCANPAGLILLTPRQRLTATPYASFAARPWATIGSDISYVGGSVGIGTESPLGPLDVRSGAGSFLYMDAANGDLRYNGGADGFFGFFNDGVAAGGTVFASHTTVHMSISNTGIVGIGTPPVTGTRLKVAGTVEADEFRFAAAKAINISIDSASFNPVDRPKSPTPAKVATRSDRGSFVQCFIARWDGDYGIAVVPSRCQQPKPSRRSAPHFPAVCQWQSDRIRFEQGQRLGAGCDAAGPIRESHGG